MTYTVYYKHINQWLWRKVNSVKGDFVATDIPGNPRVLILEDETRIELPTLNYMFKFSKERFISIKQAMEKEAAQKII